MRSKSRYPVDRYLGESSKKVEMVNLIDDDLWNSDPALRPEDEIILRKLQEMLQSTAEDLKTLSQEMSKFREPRVQVKTLPTPLDEDFNEKVHIKELVDAKFHGYKIVEPRSAQRKENYLKNNILNNVIKTAAITMMQNTKRSTKTQTNYQSAMTKQPFPKQLSVTKTKIINIIDESKNNITNESKIIKPKVAEFSYSHIEPEKKEILRKTLQVQHMPGINIRSELKEQRVLQLDILPEKEENTEPTYIRKNICVVSTNHEVFPSKNEPIKPIKTHVNQSSLRHSKTSIRKVSKMSPYEGSSSNNSISPQRVTEKEKGKKQTQIKPIHKTEVIKRKLSPNKRNPQKNQYKDLELWKKKLNVVYAPSYSKNGKKKGITTKSEPVTGSTSQQNLKTSAPLITLKKQLNNAQYIPYSLLTVGGARASDIEKEIDNVSDRGEIPLSPVIDKILSSREVSSSEQRNHKQDSKVLTTSDENLLQEVIDLENKVKKTLRKNEFQNQKDSYAEVGRTVKDNQLSVENNESYDDDFEDEKSENNDDNISEETNSLDSAIKNQTIDSEAETDKSKNQSPTKASSTKNTIDVKRSNLSFKDSVDVFEFVHSVETQESSTQSQTMQKKTLKETQTSPTNESSSLQPIHNDLWSAIDPKGKVEKLFQSEKEFIKKLILDEYGDLVEKTIAKPSTSKENTESNYSERNITSAQKITQTSPARVQSSMTSPKTTKTRTTSPLELSLKVDRHTSPFDFLSADQPIDIELENGSGDLGISINLSSPRFSLRFPKNSRELLSNLEVCGKTSQKIMATESSRSGLKSRLSSSSSAEGISTSGMSSLGEIFKPKRKAYKSRVPTISESSSSSSHYHDSSDILSSEILHLKSDGELSFQQNTRHLPAKSDGEMDCRHNRSRKK